MNRNLVIRAIVIGFALIGAAAIVIDWNTLVWHTLERTTNDAQLQGDLTRIEARVPGFITQVAVDDFQPVHRGDLLYRIEADDYEARLEQDRAQLQQAQAGLRQIDAETGMAEAQVATAQANEAAAAAELLRAQQEEQRQAALMHTAGGLQRDWQNATADRVRQQANVQSAAEAVAAAQAQIGADRAQRVRAQAEIRSRQAQVDYAQVELSYTRITAPEDGQVSSRLAFTGQFVAPGTQLLSFVPLRTVWAMGYYREEQLQGVQVGQKVRVHVDAFPDVTLHGRVNSIGPITQSRSALLPPDRATGTFTKIEQRVPVKITLDPGHQLEGRLLPGLSVEPSIDMAGR